MGTSASGKGPSPNSPLVPPWVDDNPSPLPEPLPNRFQGPRGTITRFAKSGDPNLMRRAIKGYSNKSLGGAKTAARRMALTTGLVDALLNVFDAARHNEKTPDWFQFDLKSLKGKSDAEVADLITTAFCPSEGAQDIEINKLALTDAISDLQTAYPDIEWEALTEEQVILLTDRLISRSIFLRIIGDICNGLVSAQSGAQNVKRTQDIQEYVQATVDGLDKAELRKAISERSTDMKTIISKLVEETFEIFGDYNESDL